MSLKYEPSSEPLHIYVKSIPRSQYRGFVPPWQEDCANPGADRGVCTVNPSCFYSLVNNTGIREREGEKEREGER